MKNPVSTLVWSRTVKPSCRSVTSRTLHRDCRWRRRHPGAVWLVLLPRSSLRPPGGPGLWHLLQWQDAPGLPHEETSVGGPQRHHCGFPLSFSTPHTSHLTPQPSPHLSSSPPSPTPPQVFHLLTSSVNVVVNGSGSRFHPAQAFVVPCGEKMQKVTRRARSFRPQLIGHCLFFFPHRPRLQHPECISTARRVVFHQDVFRNLGLKTEASLDPRSCSFNSVKTLF